MADTRPIGIFDSGLGGLAVLKEVRQQLPLESIVYIADQGRLPYGPRPIAEIRLFSEQITRFLIEQDVKVVVVACNTASSAALSHLRAAFPNMPFVGMEPAVKPAAEQTQSHRVGVIATQSTVQSEVFASVVERFAKGVDVLPRACPGLVTQVEAGEFDSPITNQLLHEYLDPLLALGIDSLVIGCTHFTFLTPAIQRIVGPNVRIIDPAPAVARQAARIINATSTTDEPSKIAAFTTGLSDTDSMAERLIREKIHFKLINPMIL
jgi:glutamate racemase